MYTDENGKIYLYLPVGKRKLTVTVGGKTYEGEAETTTQETKLVLE